MSKLSSILLLTSTLVITSINAVPSEMKNITINENLEIPTIIQEKIIDDIEYIKANSEPKVEFVSTISEDARGLLVETLEPEPEPEKDYVEIRVVASFYTGLEEENGDGLGGKNAIGGYLSKTSVAIPRHDELVTYGMEIEFERFSDGYMRDYNGQYLTRIADDTGNPKHIRVREDGVYRMDIYCPKLANEDKDQYWSRVNSYGKYETTAKVYLKK